MSTVLYPTPPSNGVTTAAAQAMADAAQAAAIAASQPADADLDALAANGAPGTTGLDLLSTTTPAAARTTLEITPGGSSIYMPSDLVTVLASGTAGQFERAPRSPNVVRLAAPANFGPNQADPATLQTWTATNGTKVTSSAITSGKWTVTGKADSTYYCWGGTDTAPAWRRTVDATAFRGAVMRIAFSGGTTDTGAQWGLLYSAGNAFCGFHVIGSGGGYKLRQQTSTAASTDVALTLAQANAGVWARLVVTTRNWIQFEYCLTDTDTEPTTGWVCGVAVLNAAGVIAQWIESFGVARASGADAAPVGTFSGYRQWGAGSAGEDLTDLGCVGFAAAPAALLLVPIDAGSGSTFLPNQAAARLRCADIINRLPGDAGAWVFSFTGSASAAPAEATTYQSAATLVLKDAGTDTTTTTPYRYWYLRARCTSTSGLQPASIDLSGLVIT